MSIFPGNDLIVDVARAADPAKRDMATRRLAALSQGAEFAALVQRPAPAANGPAAHRAHGGAAALGPVSSPQGRLVSTAATQRVSPAASPIKQFEAFVLQSFIELMLPKESESLFGQGVAGGVWRSMMAEQMATRIAEAGGLGLAKTLASGPLASRFAAAPARQS